MSHSESREGAVGEQGPGYRLVRSGVQVPVPGGKLIEELFGVVSTGTDAFSVARMVAPAGWDEPPQTPEFGELTVILRGRMRALVDGKPIEVGPGECLWTDPLVTVQYGNPFEEESEYLAFCMPAFTVERARR